MAGIRFDGTITLGNLLTAFGMVIPVFIWGTTVETRLAEKTALIRSIENRQDRDGKSHLDAQTEIKASLRRIEDKLDGKADKQK
jgi:hypothetical protein